MSRQIYGTSRNQQNHFIPVKIQRNRRVFAVEGGPWIKPPEPKVSHCSHALKDYINCSGVHGVNYLSEKNRPWTERLWWMSMVLAGLVVSTSLIVGVCRSWRDSPVLVTFAERPIRIFDLPFPTVTICSSHQYSSDRFDFKRLRNLTITNSDLLSPTERRLVEDIQMLCRRHFSEDPIYDNGYFRRFTDESLIRNIKMVAPNILDPAVQCFSFAEDAESCNNTVHTVLTANGVCYSYNILPNKLLYKPNTVQYYEGEDNSVNEVWSLERGYSKNATRNDIPVRPSGIGFTKGVSFTLKTHIRDEDYWCYSVQRHMISFTTPSDVPTMKEHLLLPHNGLTLIAVEPRLMDTSDDVRRYTPEKRQCFFPSERQLAYFRTYTKENCDFECFTNFTLNSCNCVEFYMPRNESTNLCGLGSSNCVVRARNLLSKENNYAQTNHKKLNSSCNCLPSCVSIQYSVEITRGVLDFDEFAEYFGVENEYENDSLNLLYIFYKRSEFLGIRRRALYSYIDLIGNCGGLLGLCCGISALSFAELFYHFTIRLSTNVFKKVKTP